jgi:hypothetical protein
MEATHRLLKLGARRRRQVRGSLILRAWLLGSAMASPHSCGLADVNIFFSCSRSKKGELRVRPTPGAETGFADRYRIDATILA